MTKQTITKAALAKLLVGDIWNIIKYASWTEFKPLPETVAIRFRVVYWCAWHWGDLMTLFSALKEAEQEHYITTEDIVVDKDTGAVLETPKYGTEFAPSERIRGHRTRHAQVSGYWREFRMRNFPE